MKRKIVRFLIIPLSMFFLGGCSQNKTIQQNIEPTKVVEEKKTEITKIEISNETQNYKDDNFGFSFTYPKSLNFETQTPYPGGTIKIIGFRVDGITESQMVSNTDLSKSLMQNDLYCNLDETSDSTLCTNINIEEIKNSKGVSGYKISRDKTFYNDDGDENILKDFVYAFPLKTKIGVSTYRAIVLTVKYPSEQNLEILKNISETVEIN